VLRSSLLAPSALNRLDALPLRDSQICIPTVTNFKGASILFGSLMRGRWADGSRYR